MNDQLPYQEPEQITIATGGQREIIGDDDQPVQVPYNVPSQGGHFAQLRKDITGSIDTKLSESVSDTLVILQDENNKPYNASNKAPGSQQKLPAHIEAQITLINKNVSKNEKHQEPYKIIFKSNLEKAHKNPNKSIVLAAENIMSSPESSYVLDSSDQSKFIFKSDLYCLDVTCSIIEIHVKKYASETPASASAQKNNPKKESFLGQVGILYLQSKKQVNIPEHIVAKNPGFESNSLNDLAKRVNKTEANITSFAVVDGSASSHISIPDLLDARVAVVDTTTTASIIENANINSDSKLEAYLIGHDQNTGGFAVEVREKTLPNVDANNDETEAEEDGDDDGDGESLLLLIEDKKPEESQSDNLEPNDDQLEPNDDQPETKSSENLNAKQNTSVKLATPSLPATQPASLPASLPPPTTHHEIQTNIQNTNTQNNLLQKVAYSGAPELPPETTSQLILPARKNSVSIFRSSFDPALLPESARVSKAFANYATHPEVQRMVRVLLGKEKNSQRCQIGQYQRATIEKFTQYTPNVAPYVESITEKMDVTPEIGYLLFIESSYAKSPKYPTTEVGGAQDVGPWQITTITGLDIRKSSGIKFNIFKVSNKPHPQDDRTYFMNATYMAANYLKISFKQFQDDPALGILSYNVGRGGASSGAKKVFKRYKKTRVTLADIFHYKIQTNSAAVPCERVNYAFTFLAARTIGQNLDVYGLDKIAPYTGKEYLRHLKRPGGILPRGL